MATEKYSFSLKFNESSYSYSYYFYIVPNDKERKIILGEMKKEQTEAVPVAKANKNISHEVYFKEQVKNPGLFFCLDQQEEWREAETFMRQVLQDFPALRVLVYFTRGKMDAKPKADYLLVTDKRDFNIFGKEKPVLKQWLRKQKFDMLLVLSRKENNRCKKLTKAIKAKLTVGMLNGKENQTEDITLGKSGERMSYFTFYNELKKYFEQMNIKLIP